MSEYYLWFKSFHVISVISWMAGMLYLPRLYAYHCLVPTGSERDKMLQTMERRLLKIIINPAMIATFVFGILLVLNYGTIAIGRWFHIKMLLVLILTIVHVFLAIWRKDFANGTNTKSNKFYRAFNEIPAVLMAIIVILVIVKPFED